MSRLPIPGRGLSVALLLLAAVLLRAPASLVTLALPAGVQLREVEGSLWDGRAAALGVGGQLVQEQLAWHFLPRSLLAGKPTWQLDGRLGGQSSRFAIAVFPGGVSVSELSLVLPLEPLAALHPQLQALRLGGTLRASAQTLDARGEAAAVLMLEQVFAPAVAPGELGSYRVDIQGSAGEPANWRLATVAGELQLSGRGSLAGSPPAIHGQLSLTPPFAVPALAPLRSGDGYRLEF